MFGFGVSVSSSTSSSGSQTISDSVEPIDTYFGVTAAILFCNVYSLFLNVVVGLISYI